MLLETISYSLTTMGKGKGNNTDNAEDDGELSLKDLFKKIDGLEKNMEQRIADSEARLVAKISQQHNSLIEKIDSNLVLITENAAKAHEALQLAYENEKSIDDMEATNATTVADLTELKKKVESLEEDVSTFSVKNKVLERRLEDQTNRSSRKSVIIRGLPEVDGETWDDTRRELCNKLSQYLKWSFEQLRDKIERVHRGKPVTEQDRRYGKRDIYCLFYDWNDCEALKKDFSLHGKNSGIYIDQKYGPNTTWRRSQALKVRKDLKEAGTIFGGYVAYPAKLMVKDGQNDRKYRLYEDFSAIDCPIDLK